MSIYYNIPWNSEKNIGKAYNDFMELLPLDDDFACFLDGDAMFLHPFFGKQLEEITEKHKECGIFTATTNRIMCSWQRAGNWDSDDIKEHRQIAQDLMAEHYLDCKQIPRSISGNLMGGVLILIKKSVWKKIGKFQEGLLGVDNELQIAAEKAGEPVFLMQGVYVYHWYRGGVPSNKDHLKTSTTAVQSDIRRTLNERSLRMEKVQNVRRLNERTKLINDLIKENNYTSYLEIGVQNKNSNFNHIAVNKKIGVDPDPNANADFITTSDDFFEQNKDKFDIIFIDGLHESEQVKKDIINSLAVLNDNGVILVHDCIPPHEVSQRVPRETRVWTGDVWKAMVYMRRDPNISISIMEIETGIGIIKKQKSNSLVIENPTYQEYVNNRKKWFSPKKKNRFKKIIYTAITGEYEKPIVHDLPEGWEFKLFTNREDTPGAIYVPNDGLSDVKLARRIKIMPWEYFDFDWCLWIDGNTVFDKDKIEALIQSDFVISRHSERDCIYDEGEAIVKFGKDTPEIIDRILERYKEEGYPKHFGLVASHAIMRKNTPENKRFCEKWWKEVEENSHRDQMSFNYILWKNPMYIYYIPFKTIFKLTHIHRDRVYNPQLSTD